MIDFDLRNRVAKILTDAGWSGPVAPGPDTLMAALPKLRRELLYGLPAEPILLGIRSPQLAILLESIGESLRIASLSPAHGTEALHACRAHSPTLKALATALRMSP